MFYFFNTPALFCLSHNRVISAVLFLNPSEGLWWDFPIITCLGVLSIDHLRAVTQQGLYSYINGLQLFSVLWLQRFELLLERLLNRTGSEPQYMKLMVFNLEFESISEYLVTIFFLLLNLDWILLLCGSQLLIKIMAVLPGHLCSDQAIDIPLQVRSPFCALHANKPRHHLGQQLLSPTALHRCSHIFYMIPDRIMQLLSGLIDRQIMSI